MEFPQYRKFVKEITVGKQLPDAVYLHESALEALPTPLFNYLNQVQKALNITSNGWNVIKFFKRDFKFSLLNYPNFLEDSYPVLNSSITVDISREIVRENDYSKSNNPPIIHRKETFILKTHPLYNKYVEITQEGEKAGLYENTKRIGFKNNWEALIKKKGYRLVNGRLKKINDIDINEYQEHSQVEIQRHLTAINRDSLSAPMQAVARHDYLNGDFSIFDYGCGKGDDLRELETHGLNVYGWDPNYLQNEQKRDADIVNLGYVINVIEDRNERIDTLKDAYKYARKLLVVSAMVAGEATINKFKPYKDGVLTNLKTFQKYFTQTELRNFIEQTLDESSVAVGPGIFFIFKDKIEEQLFLSERQTIRRSWKQLTFREPKVVSKQLDEKIDKYPELFQEFWTVTQDSGRCPFNDEFERSEEIKRIAGSHKKAFNALIKRQGKEELETAKRKRIDDLMIYFALGLFERRTAYSHMPSSLQRDIKAFFSSYTNALDAARELLFEIANTEKINQCCESAYKEIGCGQLNQGHSYIFHKDFVNKLPSLLRIYVGCGQIMYGDFDVIDLIKIHTTSGKLTLLIYDDFDNKQLPLLRERIKIRFRDQDIDFFDYDDEYEPQPLYNKSLFLRTNSQAYLPQLQFEQNLKNLVDISQEAYGPSLTELNSILESRGLNLDSIGTNI